MRTGISQFIEQIFEPFLDVIAPRVCFLCGKHAVDAEQHPSMIMCTPCFSSLSAPDEDGHIYNDLISRFPGDALALSSATACYDASAHQPTGLMTAVHALKYEGMERIGVELGEALGHHLQRVFPSTCPVIVPVPIHAARRRERGYNQAEIIALGVTSVMDCRLVTHAIRRTAHRQTQTRLRGDERIRNVQSAFAPSSEAHLLFDAEVIVIDDVLTTGATLNALAHCALRCGARRVHAATVIRAR